MASVITLISPTPDPVIVQRAKKTACHLKQVEVGVFRATGLSRFQHSESPRLGRTSGPSILAHIS